MPKDEMAAKLVQLTAAQVAPNAPLPFDVRDENGKLLMARGVTPDSPTHLSHLIERGAFVDAEDLQVAREAAKLAGKSVPAPPAEPTRRISLFDRWEQQLGQLDRLLKGLGSEPDFMPRLWAFVDQMAALIDRDADVAIFMSMRKEPRRLVLYGLLHALDAALAGRLVARRMGWDDADVRRLMAAALTMNQPIIELQGRLAVQGRAPTDSQREQLRAHPHLCAERLAAAGVNDARWLEAVRDHHERADGTGYPAGKTALDELTGVLRVVDVFMAKLSPRADRAPLSIRDAERQVFQALGGSPVAAALIKEYGLYPPGDAVRLASGEIGVVIKRGKAAQTPLVAAVTDKSGMPTTNTALRDTALPGLAIAGPAPDPAQLLRVPGERVYGWLE